MSSRTYWVGLPVGITVREDGGVSVEIDMSEAPKAIMEDASDEFGSAPSVSENQALCDSAIVEAHPGPYSVNLQRSVSEMRCPVEYSCSFRTFEIPALVEHIESGEH